MAGLEARTRVLIERVAAEMTGISGDTATRPGRIFETTPDFRMDLQQKHHLDRAALALGDEVESIETLDRAA